VAAGLLFLVESAARGVSGRPPPSDNVARVGICDLDATGLHCPGGALDVPVGAHGARPRVLVFGGSTVRNPFAHDVASDFPSALARDLPDLEIVNLGVPGADTAAVWKLVRTSGALRPDLVVLHTGHNDYNSAVFQGRVHAVAMWRLPLDRLLSESWIRAWLTSVRRVRKEPHAGRLFAVTDGAVLDRRADVDARLREELSQAVRDSPAPVVLSTLFRNFDAPPQGVDARGRPGCAAVVERIPNQKAAIGDLRSAAARVETACGRVSFTAWVEAQTARDPTTRATAWATALATDAAPLRAPASADTIIREVAMATHATLADVAVLPSGGAQRSAWFTDPLHTTPSGAEALARAMEPAIRSALQPRVAPQATP
jgi:lysophospholipase L1-like esterase